MNKIAWAAIYAAAAFVVAATSPTPAQAMVRGKPVHGIAMYGEPKYGPDAPFDFVNANAPKGGTLRMEAYGTFDSFNAFITKGTPAAGLNFLGAGTYFLFTESLMVRGPNETMTSYCLLCETVEVAEDNTWEEFTLRPEAKFHDGTPVTADDVVFSFQTLMSKGAPYYKLYWGDVAKVEKTGERKVKFTFKVANNNELPLVLGELPVLNKAFWTKHDIASGTLDVPVSTGPYLIDKFEQGRFIVYKRDPNYWGKNLWVMRGAFNFDEVRTDYFRDEDVAFEAFKAYEYDLRIENAIKRWALDYDKGQVDAKIIVKDEFEDGQPDNVQLFAPNLRRAKFADPKVREALAYCFDFDASNKTIGYGMVNPVESYFQGSDLASHGLPEGEELKILEKYRGKIPDEVFSKPFKAPRTNGTGDNRENLLKARQLLAEAGWEVKDGVLTNKKSGEKFEFEFLIAQPGLEKWIGPFLKNLERLGIKGTLRVVDTTQYINRITNYDFDMVVGGPAQSDSPGNEQRDIWGSAAADHPGSRNWSGIKNPVVDAIIEDLINAKSRESLIAYTRALDRVLLWNHYMIPEFSMSKTWYGYWNKFGRPDVTPRSGPQIQTWWFDAAKAANVENNRIAAAAAEPSTPAPAGESAAQPESSGSNRMGIIILVVVAAAIIVFALMRRRK